MIEQIITPKNAFIELQIPEELIGKTIKLIVYELPENDSIENRIREIKELTQSSLVDLSDFVFDRNEANNYDE